MKKYRSHLIISLVIVAAAISAIFGFTSVQAQTSTSTGDTLERVQDRCGMLQTRLRLAQKNDLTIRIQLGRGYDQKILSLISAFNSRVAAENVDAPELIRLGAEIREATDSSEFGQLYTVYADDLTAAIQSDCENSPAVTYGWIEKARVDRAALNEQVDEIDGLISEYITELQKLEKRFTPAINKNLESE